MVEMDRATAWVVGAGVAGLVVVLVLLVVRAHRRHVATTRRLASVTARLEQPGARARDERDSVSRLEQLASTTVQRATDADAATARLSGALGAVGQGVVVCDDAGRVVFRNAVAGDLAGTGDGRRLTDEAIDALLRDGLAGRSASRTVELVGPPRRSIVVHGLPLDDGQRPVGVVAILDDVSELRRLDVVRRDFLANVTHELKTPVGALGLLAGTIVAEDDPALTRRLAERLRRDALAVGRVIEDVAELSRLDAGPAYHREPVEVQLVVAQAVGDADPPTPAGRVSIDAAQAPAALAVLGDRRQLVSAVRRLVDNAVRFSPDGATVTVTVARREGWAEVAVADEGLGVPAAELERIFECFYRVGDDRARDPGGSGLGLAIASKVAAGHGGQLLVESTEGRGSVFTLRLPVAPEG